MPAGKPSALHTRHATKAEAEKRSAVESLMSGRALSARVPGRLKGHGPATAAWRRLMAELKELEAVIVTRLDLDLLIDYCMLTEQVEELDELRRDTYRAIKDRQAEKQPIEEDDIDAVIKIDGRVDRKRALLLQMRQSLYLTPRARAGVAPKEKEPKSQEDPMEAILNGSNNFANGDPGEPE